MQAKAMVSIHNRFDIVVTDVKTGKIDRAYAGLKPQAKNIVLDRMYTQLLGFNKYFDYIVFGSDDTTPVATNTTLGERIGSKSATQVELVRAYPTSKWTKKITLGTGDANEKTIKEVGISEGTTNINTHALITDAMGKSLEIYKTSTMIVDIYATVFITIHDVDSGLYWYSQGLMNYLMGGSAPSNSLGISNLKVIGMTTITGDKTTNSSNKTITVEGRFNVQHLNKDVRYMYWAGAGLLCEVPRTGVYSGTEINDQKIGVGNGENKEFSLGRSPNTPIENLAIAVEGVPVDFSHDSSTNIVTLDEAPDEEAEVTADYKSLYYPKTDQNVLDVTFQIGFGLGKPQPVAPAPDYWGIVPGATTPIAGNSTYGFYGEVTHEELINGECLAALIGLTSGTAQHSTESWLKFALDGKTLFVAKKTFRHSISWNNINAVNAVYGDRTVSINGVNYKIRLLRTGTENPMGGYDGVHLHGSEWNKLMLPIHEQAEDGSWAYKDNVEANVPYWGIDYTDADLMTRSTHGNGSYSWCQETYSSNRVSRGIDGVSYSNYGDPLYSGRYDGWRPVLELVP